MEFQWWDAFEPNTVNEICVIVFYPISENYTWADVTCSSTSYMYTPVCQYRIQSRKNFPRLAKL